jgi:hypothetical protein
VPISTARGRLGSNVTSPCDSLTPILYVGQPLKIFVYLSSFTSQSIFSFWLDFLSGGKNF